jgi:hypothetical protein
MRIQMFAPTLIMGLAVALTSSIGSRKVFS